MLLAMDTATRWIGIAVHDKSQVLAESIWFGRGHHTVQLAPEVGLILRRLGASASDLTAIAVAQGPGSYTGLRIGMAIAKGLATARNLPLVGIPTMDILAQSQPRRSEPMLVLIQAGRDRFAGVWYKWKRNGWRADSDPQNISKDELTDNLPEETYICGEIGSEERKLLANLPQVTLAPPAFCVRRPSFLAELAWKEVKRGKRTDPAMLTPIYLSSDTEKSI